MWKCRNISSPHLSTGYQDLPVPLSIGNLRFVFYQVDLSKYEVGAPRAQTPPRLPILKTVSDTLMTRRDRGRGRDSLTLDSRHVVAFLFFPSCLSVYLSVCLYTTYNVSSLFLESPRALPRRIGTGIGNGRGINTSTATSPYSVHYYCYYHQLATMDPSMSTLGHDEGVGRHSQTRLGCAMLTYANSVHTPYSRLHTILRTPLLLRLFIISRAIRYEPYTINPSLCVRFCTGACCCQLCQPASVETSYSRGGFAPC